MQQQPPEEEEQRRDDARSHIEDRLYQIAEQGRQQRPDRNGAAISAENAVRRVGHEAGQRDAAQRAEAHQELKIGAVGVVHIAAQRLPQQFGIALEVDVQIVFQRVRADAQQRMRPQYLDALAPDQEPGGAEAGLGAAMQKLVQLIERPRAEGEQEADRQKNQQQRRAEEIRPEAQENRIALPITGEGFALVVGLSKHVVEQFLSKPE